MLLRLEYDGTFHTESMQSLGHLNIFEDSRTTLTTKKYGPVLSADVGPKSSNKLSDICQKTVSYKNVSENSHKCVRILSENCHMQISVKNSIRKDLEMHQKCVRFYKCVRKLSVLYSEKPP